MTGEKQGWFKSIFYRDDREFKRKLGELIDSTVPSSVDTFSVMADQLMKDHKVAMDRAMVVSALSRLLMADNKSRAHKLASAINDFDLRKWVWRLGGAIAAFVTLGYPALEFYEFVRAW